MLLQLGSGELEHEREETATIALPQQIINVKTTEEETLEGFVKWCYPDLVTASADHLQIYEKAILCALNNEVDEVNSAALRMMNGHCHQYLSADILSAGNSENIPIEFLNSLSVTGIPVHNLELKEGSPFILLRNLDAKNGLCNGTKMILKRFVSRYVLEGTIVSGSHKGEHVFLPRINFSTSESDFPFTMTRRQFPIRLAFAMTINKSQGQSLKRVGVYLKSPVFSHGQFFCGTLSGRGTNRNQDTPVSIPRTARESARR